MVNSRAKVDTPAESKSKLSIKKDCAINSIKETEWFLHNLNKFLNVKHLYRFLK